MFPWWNHPTEGIFSGAQAHLCLRKKQLCVCIGDVRLAYRIYTISIFTLRNVFRHCDFTYVICSDNKSNSTIPSTWQHFQKPPLPLLHKTERSHWRCILLENPWSGRCVSIFHSRYIEEHNTQSDANFCMQHFHFWEIRMQVMEVRFH